MRRVEGRPTLAVWAGWRVIVREALGSLGSLVDGAAVRTVPSAHAAGPVPSCPVLSSLIKLTLPLTQPMCEGVTLVSLLRSGSGSGSGLASLGSSRLVAQLPSCPVAQEHGIRHAGLQQHAAAWALSFRCKSKR